MLILSACGPLTHDDAVDDLERQIRLERQRQELARLKQQNNPAPSPTASASPTPAQRPNANNQPPRLTGLEARLRSSVRSNDTVELLASASDPDGDSLEYTWASVFTGLSATRGQSAVWFPGDQELAGRTNLITLTVSDKKGGTSTGTLNIFVQPDGTLLVRENRAAQPVLAELEISQPDPGQLRLKARGIDPAGGVVRYAWTASQGLLGANSTDTTTWSPGASASGEIVIGLELSNGDGTARTRLDYRFVRNGDGSLSGDFRTIRGATAIAPANPSGGDQGTGLQGTVYGLRGNALVSASLATGQLLELLPLNQVGGPGAGSQLLYDGADTLYLVAGSIHAVSLSRLDSTPLSQPASAYRLFMLQGQACALTGPPEARQVIALASGQAIPMQNPDWLFRGEIGSQGLIAEASLGTLRVLDPIKGVQQDLLDFSGTTKPTIAWHPDGRRLVAIEGNQLHRLGLDGSKASVSVSGPPARLLWLSDRVLLGINGQPGKLEVMALDPETGAELPLSPALKAALADFSQLVPAT